MNRLSPLALAVALIACGPAKVDLPGSASVDPRFPAAQAEVVILAIDRWREATGGVAALSVSVGSGAALEITTDRLGAGDAGLTTVHTDGTADLRLDVQQIGAAARLYGITRDEMLLDVAMHELGHAFGLGHADGGLMAAEGYGGGTVDPETLRRFCENYDCN